MSFKKHLIIDTTKCVGCGLCQSVCIRRNIQIIDKKAVEENTGPYECFDCGHCEAICPNEAISLKIEDKIDECRNNTIDSSDLYDFYKGRRSCRWFKTELISKEEILDIVEIANYAPTAENSQNVEIVILSEKYKEFMEYLSKILEKHTEVHPRILEFCNYVNNGMVEKNNPFTWEGRQIILVFSKVAADAIIALSRIESLAYAKGYGGFYSRWIQLADEMEHEELMKFFPTISKDLRLNATFIIGRPRLRFKRTVPRKKRKVEFM